MLQPLVDTWPIHVFVSRTDLPDSKLLRKTRVRIPKFPVFAHAILYTLFASCAYVTLRSHGKTLRISSEGGFPFCQISYNQFCHRFFLSHHRDSLAGGLARRMARLATHSWRAFTEKVAFRQANAIVVPSAGLARELEAVYPALVAGKIHVIPNPVDTEAFSRPQDFSTAPIYTQFRIPSDSLVLSFCALGNFERKGLSIVLKALAGLRTRSVHLIVVGGTAGEIREFEALARRLEIDRLTHFAGFQKDVRPYLWSSHAFVFPSIYETFCLACFQAAAAGLPLISTSFSGIEDFLIHGVNGWKIERTPESVREAISKAAESLDRTETMGRAAKEQVQNYTPDRFQALWHELLERQLFLMS